MKGIRQMITAVFLMVSAVYMCLLGTPVFSVLLAFGAVALLIVGIINDDRPKAAPAPEPDPGYTGMPDPDLPHCPHCNKQHARELEVCPYCGTKLKE